MLACTDTECAEALLSLFQKLWQAWVTRSCLFFFTKVIADDFFVSLYRSPEHESIQCFAPILLFHQCGQT